MWLQFLSRPFVVGDRIDILTSGGTKFATGFVSAWTPSTPCFVPTQAPRSPSTIRHGSRPFPCLLRCPGGVGSGKQCMLTALSCL